MAITTTLQTKYTLQRLFIIVICIVMGLWGVYDYVYKIPAKQRAYDRGQVCLHVKEALEMSQQRPGAADTRDQIVRAQRKVQEEVERMLQLGVQDDPSLDPAAQRQRATQAIESIRASDDKRWFEVMVLFTAAMTEAQRGAPPEGGTFASAYEVAKLGVNATADISPPAKLDMATQWLFILCLPFAPYYAWSLMRARRRVYTLDEEGTLHAPEGTWSRGDIGDIEMDRWMAKSIATVVHSDGERRIKLDDYVHRNMHLIVGKLASERYPDEWQPDARRVGSSDEQADGGEAAPPAEQAATPEPASTSAP
jgi:hypothetical protein